MIYVGNWSNGDLSGKGTCYDESGHFVHYGDFLNDKPTGAYSGSGNSSAKWKFRSIEQGDGNRYIGETLDGKRHGYGAYVWASGNIWFGWWKDGIRSGRGIYLRHDGNLWEVQDCTDDNCTKISSSAR
jgi:hypothetical protein